MSKYSDLMNKMNKHGYDIAELECMVMSDSEKTPTNCTIKMCEALEAGNYGAVDFWKQKHDQLIAG